MAMETVCTAMHFHFSTVATIVAKQNMSNFQTVISYNFGNSTPIWIIPSAPQTGEKRSTFHRNNLKVRDMKLKQKEKIMSHTVQIRPILERYVILYIDVILLSDVMRLFQIYKL